MKNIYLFIAIVGFFLNLNKLNAQTQYWTGEKIIFEKFDGTNWSSEANQDNITDKVGITRANTRGIFNIEKEIAYSLDDTSPQDTEWANGTIADGVGTLTFTTWYLSNYDTATGNYTPTSQIGVNKVMHLISEDIYIDIKFLTWSSGNGNGDGSGGDGTGSGGGFSYERSTDQSLSTNEYDLNNEFKIYPNPSHDFIQITGLTSAQNFKVHNVLGAEILHGNIEKEGEINIQNLVKGIYVIHFENGTVLKFVKN